MINWLYLSPSFTWRISCLILSIGVEVEPTEILTGFFRYLSASLTILFASVAENNNVWCFSGTVSKTWLICGVKPISSIRSLSSKTKNVVLCNFKVLLFKWSLILPGVPTINLGFLCICLNCFCIESPPINKAVLIFPRPIKLFIVCITWVANSRVGVITNAVSPCVFKRKFTKGMPKAAVFPVPVWAVPKISFPSSATGIAWAWIGVGVLKLMTAIESIKIFSKFSELKFSIVFAWKKLICCSYQASIYLCRSFTTFLIS